MTTIERVALKSVTGGASVPPGLRNFGEAALVSAITLGAVFGLGYAMSHTSTILSGK
jgi:hypothetical protein